MVIVQAIARDIGIPVEAVENILDEIASDPHCVFIRSCWRNKADK